MNFQGSRSSLRTSVLAVLAATATLSAVASAHAERSLPEETGAMSHAPEHWDIWLRPELGLAILSDKDTLFRAVSLGAQLGARTDVWSVFTVLELNYWRSTVTGSDALDGVGVVNLGVGGERLFADGRGHTTASLGVSVLIDETSVDDSAGSTGVFMDLRPVGVRWPFDSFDLGLDPIGLKFIVPALDGIPLVEIQFATSINMEFDL